MNHFIQAVKFWFFLMEVDNDIFNEGSLLPGQLYPLLNGEDCLFSEVLSNSKEVR